MPKHRICRVKFCHKKIYAKRLCRFHYMRKLLYGTLKRTLKINIGKICKVEGCNNPAWVKLLCQVHYTRWRRYKNYDKCSLFPGKRIERNCGWCGKTMLVIPSRAKYKAVFCNGKCQREWLLKYYRRGKNAYNWIKSGRSMCGTDYWHVRVNGKWVREHRVIAEKMIGRKLKKREIVHHKNGIKTDNRPVNLAPLTRNRHPADTYIKVLQARIRELEHQIESRKIVAKAHEVLIVGKK